MGIVGIISFIILTLLGFSLFGWVLKIMNWILDFLSEGCATSWGCIIWIIAIAIGLMLII